jgi:hypothetical protein
MENVKEIAPIAQLTRLGVANVVSEYVMNMVTQTVKLANSRIPALR